MIKLKNTKAFTLVELIVVITILSILGTIAFVSLQGYSADARDSARTSDMSRIKTSLELFQLDAGKYPETTDPLEITYKGGVVWTQGTFGNQTFSNVGKLDKIPTDPLTDKKYIYSTTSTKQEFQLAGILEGDELVLNNELLFQASAVEKIATLKITGNYNGKLLKVSTGSLIYLLAVPSLITSSGLTLEEIISNKLLAYDGYKNLPLQYTGSSYNVLGDSGIMLVDVDNYELYSGATLNVLLSEDPAERITLLEGLQKAYSGTVISEDGTIKEILAITDFSISNLAAVNLAGAIVSNTLGYDISTSGGNDIPVVVDSTNCRTILESDGSSFDGIYTIDPEDNGIGFDVYCDMITNGGGWTLVMRGYGGSSTGWDTNLDINSEFSIDGGLQTTSFKFSDTYINNIRATDGIYRLISDGIYSFTRFSGPEAYNHILTAKTGRVYANKTCSDVDLLDCKTLLTISSADFEGIGDVTDDAKYYFVTNRGIENYWVTGNNQSAARCVGSTIDCSFSMWVK
ncbi:MAG: fibrinogen-like YCDxxxxGGGW domain-containing protein [Candidatus Gracilibacteria bacterium]